MNTKKKAILSSLMALILVFGLFPITTVVQANTPTRVVVNDRPVEFTGQQPVIVDGRTLVPVRGVFEQLGFDVGWDGPTQRVTLTSNTHTIILTIGSASFTTNGVSHTLDVPAQIINGSTMLPIRAVAESVGLAVGWGDPSGMENIITISGNMSAGSANNTPIAPATPATPTTPAEPEQHTRPPLHPQHIIIRERTFFTQEQLSEMIAFAPDEADTRHSTPHPMRAMTPEEVRAWSDEYFAMGGLNAQELEIIYLVNAERIAHGLQPYYICPALSQGARLTSQLLVEQGRQIHHLRHGDLIAHRDPHYGMPGARNMVFRDMLGYIAVGTDENLVGNRIGTTTPAGAASAWMNSPGHRSVILNPDPNQFALAEGLDTQFVGIGVFEGVFALQRASGPRPN